jgi:hypothetical protein
MFRGWRNARLGSADGRVSASGMFCIRTGRRQGCARLVGCAKVVVIWGNTPDCGSVGDNQRPSVLEHSGTPEPLGFRHYFQLRRRLRPHYSRPQTTPFQNEGGCLIGLYGFAAADFSRCEWLRVFAAKNEKRPLIPSSIALPKHSQECLTMTTAGRTRYTHAHTDLAQCTQVHPLSLNPSHQFLQRPCESHDTTSNFGRIKITTADA